MLNNIRNFSKTWFAKILLVIIIIPFVFWGMGGVFSGGNGGIEKSARAPNQRMTRPQMSILDIFRGRKSRGLRQRRAVNTFSQQKKCYRLSEHQSASL